MKNLIHVSIIVPCLLLAACAAMTPDLIQNMSDISAQANGIAAQRQADRSAVRAAQVNAMNTTNACRAGCNSDHSVCAQQAAYARYQPGGIGAAMNACDAQNRICFSGC